MIFEWYSGSDSKKKIPKRLMELLSEGRKSENPEAVVREVLKLVDLEQDPNMKGKIYYAAAKLVGDAGNYERYQELCRRALTYFDPLAANFPQVAREYVRSNYGATENEDGDSDSEIENNAPLQLAALVWGDCGRLEEDDRVLLWRGLSSFFALCGERYGASVFWKLAELCNIRAHHRFSEDPYCLALIARARQELGDAAGFERIRRMVEELGYDIYNLPEP